MATNQMRREAAKRKLERQQERRLERAKRRQQVAVITAGLVVVVVVAGIVLLSSLGGRNDPAAPPAAEPPQPVAGSCSYPVDGTPAKANQPPPTTDVPTEGSPGVSITTSAGSIGLTLSPGTAPCTVNSFVSLAQQKYFDGTPCHRLTTSDGLKVLQCGDPTGSGSGGPGYTIVDEPPTGLAPAPGGSAAVYPRGTLAMAKTSAPNSGGSQFFLVYADSTLPPEYTVFGTIDEQGLATLDTIAAAGSDNANGQGDGAPLTPVSIQTVTVS